MKQTEAQNRVLLKSGGSASIATVPKADVCKPEKGFFMNQSRIFSRIVPIVVLLVLRWAAHAQVNSGSNGSDGALNPTTNIVINMADHPDGIYQYTSVNISNGVTVTFSPNLNNTPVVWLVQSNCVIEGTVDLSGQTATNTIGGLGGSGGYRAGGGGSSANPGQGPGGGAQGTYGGNASYGSLGSTNDTGVPPGTTYGNVFLVPLVGGSGGGGGVRDAGGGGGGGAILIAASGQIAVSGTIRASGGWGMWGYSVSGANPIGGGGSGGGIRLVASSITGYGSVLANGGEGGTYWNRGVVRAGSGRVRFDTLENSFAGTIQGVFTQGLQPIIIQTNGQGAQLTVTSVGGVPVSASPTGQIATPDAVLSSLQNNPIPIVVHCSNIPLNTQITVTVRPANGLAVSATAYNNTGTLSSSTATISINMPRGGGIIYATAAN